MVITVIDFIIKICSYYKIMDAAWPLSHICITEILSYILEISRRKGNDQMERVKIHDYQNPE